MIISEVVYVNLWDKWEMVVFFENIEYKIEDDKVYELGEDFELEEEDDDIFVKKNFVFLFLKLW